MIWICVECLTLIRKSHCATISTFKNDSILMRFSAYIFRCWAILLYDKFEETPNDNVINMSKLTKPYFKNISNMSVHRKLTF